MTGIKKIKTAFTEERYRLTVYCDTNFHLPTSRQGRIFEYLTLRHWPVNGLKTAASASGVSALVAGFGQVVEELLFFV